MLGSDLRRVWWGAWGDPRGFVPRMADYFKLCNIAKSDAARARPDRRALEPKLVGSWIGVWGGKVITGWHFCDPQPWPKVEAMFGTHEAKYQIKKWVDYQHGVDRIERFSQAIGDASYSEIELAMPGDTVDDAGRGALAGVRTTSPARRSTPRCVDRLRARGRAGSSGSRCGSAAARSCASAGSRRASRSTTSSALCSDAKVGVDPKLPSSSARSA